MPFGGACGRAGAGIVPVAPSYVAMNREGLQSISRQRRREAAALLKAKLFPGAYYLAGYSVECALKACIAKQTSKHDFPNKKLAAEAWTHDLKSWVQLQEPDSILRGT